MCRDLYEEASDVGYSQYNTAPKRHKVRGQRDQYIGLIRDHVATIWGDFKSRNLPATDEDEKCMSEFVP